MSNSKLNSKFVCNISGGMFSPPQPPHPTHPETTPKTNFGNFDLIWIKLGGVHHNHLSTPIPSWTPVLFRFLEVWLTFLRPQPYSASGNLPVLLSFPSILCGSLSIFRLIAAQCVSVLCQFAMLHCILLFRSPLRFDT